MDYMPVILQQALPRVVDQEMCVFQMDSASRQG